jgi:hypothetical protein
MAISRASIEQITVAADLVGLIGEYTNLKKKGANWESNCPFHEEKSPSFKVLGNALFSQINIHKEYGGVYPMLAKREHAKNLPILFKKVLEDSSFYKEVKIRV